LPLRNNVRFHATCDGAERLRREHNVNTPTRRLTC
jgi:hypothetical protein